MVSIVHVYGCRWCENLIIKKPPLTLGISSLIQIHYFTYFYKTSDKHFYKEVTL